MTTVVFCEDDAVIQRLIQVATRSLPYTVHVVGDGASGLVTIEHERPAAVFTDLTMPGLNGRQLIEAVRARPDLAHIPIVVMTASGLPPNELDDLLGRGASDYLPKPFGPNELRAKLEQVLTEP